MNLVTPRFTLLQKKVSFDDQPTDLFYTLCIGNSNVMALLMTAPGANLAIENDDGKTVEQLARYSSNRSSNVTTHEEDAPPMIDEVRTLATHTQCSHSKKYRPKVEGRLLFF